MCQACVRSWGDSAKDRVQALNELTASVEDTQLNKQYLRGVMSATTIKTSDQGRSLRGRDAYARLCG